MKYLLNSKLIKKYIFTKYLLSSFQATLLSANLNFLKEFVCLFLFFYFLLVYIIYNDEVIGWFFNLLYIQKFQEQVNFKIPYYFFK